MILKKFDPLKRLSVKGFITPYRFLLFPQLAAAVCYTSMAIF
jgi:hypothetical protein